MLDVNTIKDDRQMLSLTGLKLEEFCLLAEHFSKGYRKQLDSNFEKTAKLRQRKAGGGRKGTLVSMEQKLFFILYYLKVYPTFDVLSASFEMARSKACENAHKLAVALYFTLQDLGVLPARHIESATEMEEIFKDIKLILVDATERPYLRSKDALANTAHYSGKKKIYA
jgi:Helix-turn-helix of DDE superfamily endonuclease